ncbi:hypothetical protein [Streptomyces sp. DH37]|uniref:hypothetical protein n=1 Tax=Streptomyces sp. DH37 TaxID=3040122 RepID=UPI002442BFD0|nr:hypothetical protein [Streptomyces sp. DH37]MDG9701964.1 hypothetical protein [Streptomyces sp. DH37]
MAPFGRVRAERLRRQTAEAYEKAIAYQRTPGRESALRALEAFGEAHRSLEQLLEQHPGDRELWHMRGALLYSEASSHLEAGRRSEAIASLDRCEEAYRRSAHPDGGVLIADAVIRRARAHSEGGNALSALADVDAAITAYVREGAFASPHPRLADFARVLAVASTVHLESGDSDQALACARQSLSRYRDLMAARGHLPADHIGYAVGMAGDTATRLEAAHGNWGAALGVGALVLQAAEQGWGSLGAALARQGLYLRLAGHPRQAEPLLARAEQESPGSVAREEEIAALALPPTLAGALTTAESLTRRQPRSAVPPHEAERLREALTAHESYSASSRLTDPSAFPARAARLTALADLLMGEGEVARSWRVAAETHLMCQAAMRQAGGSARAWSPHLAVPWCGALEVGTRAALAAEEPSLLRDLRDTVRAVRTLLDPSPQDTCHELLETARTRLDTAIRRFP